MRLLPQLYNFRLAFWTLFMFWSALSRYVEEEEKIQSHHVISKVSKKYLMWVWMAGEPTDFSTPASVFVDGWKYLWHNTSACHFIIWFGSFLNMSCSRAENEQWVLFLSFLCLLSPPLPFLPTCKHLGDVLSWNWFTWSMIIWHMVENTPQKLWTGLFHRDAISINIYNMEFYNSSVWYLTPSKSESFSTNCLKIFYAQFSSLPVGGALNVRNFFPPIVFQFARSSRSAVSEAKHSTFGFQWNWPRYLPTQHLLKLNY